MSQRNRRRDATPEPSATAAPATLAFAPGFEVPRRFVTDTQAILGQKGGGKTYKGSIQAEVMLAADHHVVVLDPTGAWWGLRSGADGLSPGFPITIFGGDHGDLQLEGGAGAATAGAQLAEAIVHDRFSAIVDLSSLMPGEATRYCAAFLEALYRRNRRAMHLFLDEADVFAPQRPQGTDENRLLGVCQSIVRRGRIRGIGCTMITQRAAVVDKSVLSQVDTLTLLRMSHPMDMRPIGDWVAVHGDPRRGLEMRRSLPDLPVGDAWVWSPQHGIFSRVTFPARRTFDSGRTPEAGDAGAPSVLAAVDVERLGAAIAATVSRARENDPAALRARIAGMERELAAARDGDVAQDRRDVVNAANAARTAEARARAALEEITSLRESAIQTLGNVAQAASAVATMAREASVAIGERRGAPARRDEPRHHLDPECPEVESSCQIKKPRRARASPTQPMSPSRLSGEAQILRLLVARHQAGRPLISGEAITALTGYRRSTRNTYIQRLVSRGLVERRDQLLAATAAGVAAEPNAVDLDLKLTRQLILQILPPGESQILGVLFERYPAWVDRDQFSRLATGAQFRRSTRNTYIQRLRSRCLVEVRPSGGPEIRAAEALFGDA